MKGGKERKRKIRVETRRGRKKNTFLREKKSKRKKNKSVGEEREEKLRQPRVKRIKIEEE